METFIVISNNGNRRIRASDPIDAWRQVCPNKIDVKFKPISPNSNKLLVLDNHTQIGQVTLILNRTRRSS